MTGRTIDYSITPVSFYKFVCINPEIKSCYVGSTINFTERKAQHKKCCNGENYKQYNQKIYQIIRANGGWSEWRMIEIEKRIVKDKREAERIEQEFIEQLQSDMNCNKSYCGFETKQEYRQGYYQEHKEKFALHNKEYYQEHRDEIALKHKEYLQKHKKEIALYKKEYQQEHREEISLKQKEYRQENKEKISLKKGELLYCECGCVITRDKLNRHKLSQKHKDLMETKQA